MEIRISKHPVFNNCWWGHAENGAPFGIYKMNNGFEASTPFKLLTPLHLSQFKAKAGLKELPLKKKSQSLEELSHWCKDIGRKHYDLIQILPDYLLHQRP